MSGVGLSTPDREGRFQRCCGRDLEGPGAPVFRWQVGQSQAGDGIGECAHTVRGSGAFVPADWGMEVTWGNLSLAPGPSRVTKDSSPLELIVSAPISPPALPVWSWPGATMAMPEPGSDSFQVRGYRV